AASMLKSITRSLWTTHRLTRLNLQKWRTNHHVWIGRRSPFDGGGNPQANELKRHLSALLELFPSLLGLSADRAGAVLHWCLVFGDHPPRDRAGGELFHR